MLKFKKTPIQKDPSELLIASTITKNIIVTNFMVLMFSIILFGLLTFTFYSKYVHILDTNKQLNTQITNKHEITLILQFVNTKIEVKKDNKFYSLDDDHNLIITSKSKMSEAWLKFNIHNNIFYFPYYFKFKYTENIDLLISIENILYSFILTLTILISTIILFNLIYYKLIKKEISQRHICKISAQEYALSDRTTSYLVSIMHHKLNTPLKIISTKSRILFGAIDKSLVSDDIKNKATTDYTNMKEALDNIFKITSKLKSYQELSKKETNIYKLFEIAKETIEILRDDSVSIKIDNKISDFEIYKDVISSHEMIQIFINQIKFSVEQMCTSIHIKVFKSDEKSLTILFSDNGNQLSSDLVKAIKNKVNISKFSDMSDEYLDIILNVNILNDSSGNLRLISTNSNGNTYEIKIPAIKSVSIN